VSSPSDVLAAAYAGRPAAEARALAGDRPLDAAEAAALGDLEALDAALARDPDAHAMRSGDGWTPLHLAGFFGHDDCAARLLAAGASLSALSENSTANTPLHAALAGRVNAVLVTRLVNAGAEVTALGAREITPLHLAASRGETALCDLLVARGARADARMDDGTTPADYAAQRGHPELAARLRGGV
jgi:ankyrin repeat protein